MFMMTAPAPNKAAAPTAPVIIGAAAGLADGEAPLPSAPVAAGAPEPMVVEASGRPLVNGGSEALDAPGKAAEPEEAVSSGAAEVLLGLRTLKDTVSQFSIH